MTDEEAEALLFDLAKHASAAARKSVIPQMNLLPPDKISALLAIVGQTFFMGAAVAAMKAEGLLKEEGDKDALETGVVCVEMMREMARQTEWALRETRKRKKPPAPEGTGGS